RSDQQLGTSEIWRAMAGVPLTGVTVTATLSQSVPSSITVVGFGGADASGTNGSAAIGATVATNKSSGAPAATLVTTRNNSWVYAVGDDWDNAISRTMGSNQVMVHQYLAPVGDTYWVQRRSATTPSSGTTVTINDTAPTSDRYNMAAVEILPASGAVPTPTPTPTPSPTPKPNPTPSPTPSPTPTATPTPSPSPTPSGTSVLAKAAAALTPGQWFHFTAAENTSWNKGALLNLAPTHTGTDNATAWSTKGLWNPVTKEFYFVGGGHCGSGNSGCPGTQMVLRYSDSTNTWSANYRDGGHTYEGATINTTPGANNDVFMRLYSSTSINTYDIASQAWASTSIASVPNGSDCCLAMEYFPDRNSLITVDNDYGVYEYSFSTGKWGGCLFGTSSSVGCPNGTHNFCGASSTAAPWERYDPVNHRMLLGGCSNVFALSSSLGLTQLSSAPFSISVGTTASPVTIDPGTGKLIS